MKIELGNAEKYKRTEQRVKSKGTLYDFVKKVTD